MKLWIARDKTGLWLYTTKPLFNPYRREFEPEDGDIFCIDDDIFPQVDLNNSPQQVEIKLINNE